jgi:hypothetical protein
MAASSSASLSRWSVFAVESSLQTQENGGASCPSAWTGRVSLGQRCPGGFRPVPPAVPGPGVPPPRTVRGNRRNHDNGTTFPGKTRHQRDPDDPPSRSRNIMPDPKAAKFARFESPPCRNPADTLPETSSSPPIAGTFARSKRGFSDHSMASGTCQIFLKTVLPASRSHPKLPGIIS